MPRRKTPKGEGPTTQLMYAKLGLGDAAYQHQFTALAASLVGMAKVVSSRTTIGQLQVLCAVAQATGEARPITVNELQRFGENANKSYRGMLATPNDPNGEGLLWQLADEDDARRKYLFLTNEGMDRMREIAQGMEAARG